MGVILIGNIFCQFDINSGLNDLYKMTTDALKDFSESMADEWSKDLKKLRLNILGKVELSEEEQAELKEKLRVLEYEIKIYNTVVKKKQTKADEIRVKLGAKLASDFVKQTKEKLFEMGDKIGEKIEEIQENEEFKEIKKSASEFIVNKYKEIEE